MRVLIAGCGWLGREVASRLAARGDRVAAITRTEPSAAWLRDNGIDAQAIDIARTGALLRIGYDAIVATQAAGGRDEEAYSKAYLDVTRSLLESVGADGASLVYTSSTGVFGQSDGSCVDESTPPAPADATARVLVAAERLVLESARQGAAACVVRCSGLYGPGRTGVVERVRSGALALGDGDDAWMNFAHRDDAAVTVIAALDRGRPGAIYHASDAGPATRQEVVSWIAERLGITPTRREDGAGPHGKQRAHRRVLADASRHELGIELAYPTFREGLAPLIT